MNPTYVRLEIRRLFRNRQNFAFSLIMPVLLFCFIAGPNKDQRIGGLPFATYYLAGMITFGAIGAVIGGGARIALERETGWIRQLKISPLTPASYLRTKVLTSYLLAVLVIVVVSLVATGFGVRLSAAHWLEMGGLILVGLIPFALLGVGLGHLIRGDAMGPVMGLGMSFLSILGGAFGPLATGGVLLQIMKCIPSYWIVQAGQVSVGGSAWGVRGWITVAVWAALCAALATWAYRRDSGKA